MLRVLSLFSGIGAFETALNEEDIDWELDHYCEIDKYACQSYNMVHGTCDDDNLKDVTNIDYSKIGHIDLLTYGFPCQDISLAGQQKGFVDEDGNVTRSGLFFSAADIIRHTNPKFAIFENVKNLTSKKFKAEFETVLTTLDELGYNTYWQVLNAKDYGIPQNRERVFGISIRKDIDHGFKFPDGFPLKLRLKDMLEDNVDKKYYLSQKATERFEKQAEKRGEDLHSHDDNRVLTLAHGYYKGSNKADDICPTIDTQFTNCQHGVLLEPKAQRLGGVFDDEKGKHQAGSIWDKEQLSPTLDTMQGGWRQPCIIDNKVKELGFIKKSENGKKHQSNTVYDSNGLARTLTACDYKSPMMCTVEEPHMNIPENTKKGYKEAYEGDGVYINRPHQKRGTVQHGMIQTLKTGQDVGVVVKEPQVMRYTRTEYAKNIRKDYEAGNIRERRCNMRQLEPRKDGISNTLTTVQKDNYVIEPVNPMPDGTCRTLKNQYYKTSKANFERSSTFGATGVTDGLRIRKLTPRECWRLMGFKDRYFDRVHGVSNTQLYKQAGNSIVVDVLRAIFREFKEQYPDDFQDWEGDL